jgi:predicted enzyme related to lactoylglutathione lyase
MTRLYRRHPDSSGLEAPRVLVRVLRSGGSGRTVRFYEALTSVSLDQDMDIPEAGTHVVAVGPFLILELDREKLARYDRAVETHATVLVAHLDDAVEDRVADGAEVIQPRFTTPVGAGARLKHPDGLLIEYVEHRPGPDDVGEPGPVFR